MELAQGVGEDFDKENVAPPLAKAGIKPNNNHLSGVNQKHSDDDSTDCFVVESSTSEQSACASPLPGILSSASLAHVEGNEKVEEVTAEAQTEAVSKKKRKKKKKKKKKAKANGEAEAEAEAAAAASTACGDVDMREERSEAVPEAKVEKKEPPVTEREEETREAAAAAAVSNACGDVDMREERPEAVPEAEASREEEMQEPAAAAVEEEEGEIRETASGVEEARNFDVLDDTAVLAVGRRPLIELGTSSDSEPEHRPVYDEEYVTVDEEAPTPLLNIVQEPEEGEVEEEVLPEAACEHEEPFEEPTEEMVARIVRQMEFYFSDANILKDYFLLRRVRKSKGGWVRVSLLAGFKLVQSITKDIRQVIFALKQKSTLLEIDESGLRVRRRGGLPCWDHHVYKRTCLVYGFDRHPPRRTRPNAKTQPDNVSVQFVREKLFPKFDSRILLVRILKAGKEVPLDLKTCVRNHPQLGQELCVVVEFDTVPTAEAARSFVDGRRWSKSHRLWAKILGKRPRLPEEWASRFGAQRAELLQQQQQQYRDRRGDPAYYHHQLQQQQAHQQQLLQQLYYQQQQQKFLEELQKRRWGEKKFSYADSVRGKKRPAPESYADKVRGNGGGKSDAEQPTEAEADAGATAATAEQRKVAPRVRARAKKSGGEARAMRKTETEEREKEKAPKPKATSYAAAARKSGEAGKAKDVRRDGATQTPASEQSERKERAGLQLLREPRGPSEAGSGPAWVRRAAAPDAKDAEAEAKKSAEADINKMMVEKNAEAIMDTEPVKSAEAVMDMEPVKSAEAVMDMEPVKSAEAVMDTEPVKSAEADDDNDACASPEPSGKSSGLVRRRSVRELVRQFEALTASPNEEEASSPRRLSMTPRSAAAAASGRDSALGEVPEL